MRARFPCLTNLLIRLPCLILAILSSITPINRSYGRALSTQPTPLCPVSASQTGQICSLVLRKLTTPKGIFLLVMQGDGNLVQYADDNPRTTSMAYWASNTDGAGNNVTLNLDDDGYLYLLNSNSVLQNLTTGGYPKTGMMYLMRIDVDGIFRLYSHRLDQKGNWSILWQSSNDKCDPKGLCGLNGFCTTMDQEPECKCLPGFDFVDPNKWSSGCERNFTAPSCKDKGAHVEYAMTPLPSTSWEV